MEKIEILACIIQLISTLLLIMFTVGMFKVIVIVNVLGFILLILGVITYIKHRHKINIANIYWGIYTILLMQLNFYFVYDSFIFI